VWTGAWTGAPGNPSAMCAFVALTRGVSAGQACVANERASHNPPVLGSSPSRPSHHIPVCSAPDLRNRQVRGAVLPGQLCDCVRLGAVVCG
jgi:hypothetical protein